MHESNVADWGFFIFGLAFFIYIIWAVEAWEDKRYRRKLDEAREFGFKGSRLETDSKNGTDPH